MAPSNASPASALREAYSSTFTVTLPNGLTVECRRRPDLADALFRGVLPMPLLTKVLQELAPSITAGNGDEKKTAEAFIEGGGGMSTAELVDIWTCMAARSPRVVLHDADVTDDSIWVRDLPLSARLEIFAQTFEWGEAARQAAAATFRAEPAGAAGGTDSPPVQSAAVDAVAAD